MAASVALPPGGCRPDLLVDCPCPPSGGNRMDGSMINAFGVVAEGEGFEPPVRFPVQRFSRPPVSTTHTSLRVNRPTPLRVAFLR
jgi:hypothetical protein